MSVDEISESTVREDLVTLEHTVNIPCHLFTLDAPLVSPWFSNEKLMRLDLMWRICWSSKKLLANGSYGRDVWVQAVSASERRILKSDPRNLTPTNITPQNTNFIISSISVICKRGASSVPLVYAGLKDFLSTASLLALPAVKQSSLTDATAKDVNIAVKIELVRPLLEDTVDLLPAFRLSPEQVQFSSYILNRMLQGGLALADVTLKVEKEEMKAHRVVLSANSPVFEAMFKHNFEENKVRIVKIEDISPSVMRVALQHMYGMEIKDVDSDMYLELLAVAEKYQLSTLKSTCEDFLISDRAVDVLKTLLVADTNNATRLKEHILHRIVKHPSRQNLLNDKTLRAIASTHAQLIADLLKAMAIE